MDETTRVQQRTAVMKLRKELRLIAVTAIAFGSGMILVMIGIFLFYNDFLVKARLSPQTKDLAQVVSSFTMLLIACNAIAVITAIYALRYIKAEEKTVAQSSVT